MPQTSPAEIKVSSLHQMGIVVKNVEKVAQNYWNILGIGPWTILIMRPPHSYGRTYHEKPAYFEWKVGLCQVGSLELELMETLEGPTFYGDFLAERGEGLNHLQYLVDSVDIIDKHVEIMTKKGFPSLMGGRFGSNGGFNHLDTMSALKTSWEPVKMADKFSGPSFKYPANEAEVSPAKIKVKAITQIAIAVKSLEETMENYWNIFGIGPWDVVECAPPTLHDITYYDKPGNYTFRVGLTMAGPIQIELMQPVSGDNIYSDFLAEHGEGLHHFQFLVDDIDETTRIMNEEGFPTIQSGGFSDGAFAYYDTVGPLKTILEAFKENKTMPPMNRYP